jgi:hypothetical protein
MDQSETVSVNLFQLNMRLCAFRAPFLMRIPFLFTFSRRVAFHQTVLLMGLAAAVCVTLPATAEARSHAHKKQADATPADGPTFGHSAEVRHLAQDLAQSHQLPQRWVLKQLSQAHDLPNVPKTGPAPHRANQQELACVP